MAATGSGGSDGLTKRDALTVRERQILRALGQGARDKEIAFRLGLSVYTVRAHIRNARVKLHASSRAHAVVLAAR